jgi:hypothetical protein
MAQLGKRMLAAGLVLAAAAGCATDGKQSGPVYRCRAVDASGGVYFGESFDKVAAGDQALQQCQYGAGDPTTCQTGGCTNQW